MHFYKMNLKIFVLRLSLISCLPWFSVVAMGQAKFYTRIDQQVVGKNQPVQLQYVVENAKSIIEFKAPLFNDFILIQGPIESSGMSVINGNTTQYKSLVYLLLPKVTGRLNIKGATALVDGERDGSNNIVVVVTNKTATSFPIQIPDSILIFQESSLKLIRSFT